ncbi:MAG: ATP-binding cassette domain-containing protein [Parasporobacterium sp.]|nr:ATP-binding cassette domain-containing protein [Parasporobacterium sp.]
MIEIRNVSKTFNTSGGPVDALKNVNLSIEDGDIFGIIGMSGAGKSTLVRCINMLERPTEGQIMVDNVDLGSLSVKELRAQRHDITMIFQGFNLLMQKTCLKNVMFPLELQGVKKAEAKKKALELLDIVGLLDKAKAYPAQLSGGQQQRVAIARAMTTNPKVLLCDEATSALDPNTTNSILELIKDLNKRLGITVVVITHQMSVVESICRHVAILDHGVVVEQGAVEDVFAHPKSDAAKNLVFPEGKTQVLNVGNQAEHFIRVVYNGANAAGRPMIARLAIEKGIEANISYASTKGISGKAFGTILLSISGTDSDVKDAIEYLTQEPGIEAEEVQVNVC